MNMAKMKRKSVNFYLPESLIEEATKIAAELGEWQKNRVMNDALELYIDDYKKGKYPSNREKKLAIERLTNETYG
jgi:metal-responsive CopG/Arc/MetJ family transcriptional regulator